MARSFSMITVMRPAFPQPAGCVAGDGGWRQVVQPAAQPGPGAELGVDNARLDSPDASPSQGADVAEQVPPVQLANVSRRCRSASRGASWTRALTAGRQHPSEGADRAAGRDRRGTAPRGVRRWNSVRHEKGILSAAGSGGQAGPPATSSCARGWPSPAERPGLGCCQSAVYGACTADRSQPVQAVQDTAQDVRARHGLRHAARYALGRRRANPPGQLRCGRLGGSRHRRAGPAGIRRPSRDRVVLAGRQRGALDGRAGIRPAGWRFWRAGHGLAPAWNTSALRPLSWQGSASLVMGSTTVPVLVIPATTAPVMPVTSPAR